MLKVSLANPQELPELLSPEKDGYLTPKDPKFRFQLMIKSFYFLLQYLSNKFHIVFAALCMQFTINPFRCWFC